MLEAGPAPLTTPARARSRPTPSPRGYRRIGLAALVLLATIVVTGAAVRLSGSGLGCSSWPNCEPEEFIAIGDPNQTIEQVNRLFTGLVGLAVIAAVLGAMRRVPFRHDLVWLAWGLVVGVIGQILLGGVTVLSHLHPVAVSGPVLSGAGPHAGDDWEAVRRFQLPIPDAARIHSLSAWALPAATVVVIAATWFQLGLLDPPVARQATRQEPLGGATI
jgi:cytochrome c oxidase assembly protein subunit 15